MQKTEMVTAWKMFDKLPELRQYIPVQDPDLIGMSTAGNIKYSKDGSEGVVRKDVVPNEIIGKLFFFLTGNTLYLISNKPPIRITLEYFKQLPFQHVSIPRINDGNVYVKFKNGHAVVECALSNNKKKKKRGLFSETPIFPNEPDVSSAAAAIIGEVYNDPSRMEAITEIVTSTCTQCLDSLPALKEKMADLTDGIGHVIMRTLGPCVIVECTSRVTQNLSKTFSCYADGDVAESIASFVETCAKDIVERHNEVALSSAASELRNSVHDAIKSVLAKKCGITVRNVSYQDDAVSAYHAEYEAKTENGYTIRAAINKKWKIPDDALQISMTGDTGLTTYVVTDSGKKWAASMADALSKKLIDADWTIDDLKKGSPAIIADEYCKEEAALAEPSTLLYFGRVSTSRRGIQQVKYHPADRSFSYSSKVSVITVSKSGKMTVKYSDQIDTIMRESTQKRCLAAQNHYLDSLAAMRPPVNIQYLSGAGILCGDTICSVRCRDMNFQYSWQTAPYRDSLPKWRQQTEKNLKEIHAIYEKQKEEERQRVLKTLGEYVGDFIAIDAARFVDQNRRYITENATIHYLRGLSTTFGGSIEDTGREGQYKETSSDHVERIIDGMIRKNIFGTVTLKGTYGKFDILKPTELSAMLKDDFYPKLDQKELLKLLDDDKPIRDCYAKELYALIKQKPSLELGDYVSLLKLSRSHGFVCRCYKEFISTLRQAPDAFHDFMKMQKEMTEDPFYKKVLTQALRKEKQAG